MTAQFDRWSADQREWALRHPIDVIRVVTCPVQDHAEEGAFWLTLLGWTIEGFVEQAFSGVWERTA